MSDPEPSLKNNMLDKHVLSYMRYSNVWKEAFAQNTSEEQILFTMALNIPGL